MASLRKNNRHYPTWRDALLQSIETNAEVAVLCRATKKKECRVYVHRCGDDEHAPLVCCSAKVRAVEQVGQDLWEVAFEEQLPLADAPRYRPQPHQNFYWLKALS